jgi:phospholipid/cholesterol/gamma-HCH transport system ATP-binding protein
VLENINLTVRRGETLAIMGGSGQGKTVLLRLLTGVYKPDAGEVLLFGKDIGKMTRDELDEIRKRFSIVFQGGALYNSMTVGENVALPLKEHQPDLDPNIVEIIVKMMLDLVGLRGFEGHMPAEISGGMAKRVAVARAIALDPDILFYDEPTAGLDPIMSSVITQLIIDLNKKLNVTSVVVTHDRECAFKAASQIAMIYQGRILDQGPPEQIRNSINGIVRQFIEGAPDGPIPLRQSSDDYMQYLVSEGGLGKVHRAGRSTGPKSLVARMISGVLLSAFVILIIAGIWYALLG